MSTKSRKKIRSKKRTPDGKRGKKPNRLAAYVALAAAVLVSVLILVNAARKHNGQKGTVETYEPRFNKEGTLDFISGENGRLIKTIDIEISDNPEERVQGLMFRDTMPDSVGMLFLFDTPQPRYFWMKNTNISLDILFADTGKKIVSIQKYTIPHSQDPIPSYRDALYVVEVNAGFCDRYKIKEGDLIVFKRL
jgi:uncharacterized membrane protein (UPF0127 family)